jgi:hypothetical protein
VAELKRYVTLFLAATVGIAAAVGYGYFTWTPKHPAAPAVSKDDPEMETLASSLSVCIVFFGVTYLSGRLFARLLNARDLAEEIRGNSTWHMRLLMLLSALIGFERWWFARGRVFGRFDDWVALGVALSFAAVAIVFEIGRHRRERES